MQKKCNKKNSHDGGFTMIELVMVLAVMSIMLPALLIYIKDSNLMMTQKAASVFMRQVGMAAETYVTDHYQALLSTSTSTVATEIPIATLINDDYLSATFNTMNPWYQNYKIYVLEPSTDDLALFVLTEGGQGHDPDRPDFGTKVIPKTANMIGAEGGYVPTGLLTGEPNTMIQGAYGGWSFAFAGTNIPNPGSAHLAYYKYFVDGTADDTDDYLHRVVVPGRPELNRMQTTLDMDGNNILMGDGDVGGGAGEGVGRINFERHTQGDFPCTAHDNNDGSLYFDRDRGLLLCRKGQLEQINDTGNTGSMQLAKIVTHGSIINKPTCPTSLPTPQIFLSPAMFSEDAQFRSIQAVQTWAVDQGSRWVVRMRIMANGSWMSPNNTYGKIMATVTCGP
jgi:prepilin-type N-terminal cleavage/methylation domain-containing protein